MSGFDFLLHYGIDYTTTTAEYVKYWTDKSLFICGCLTILIFAPIVLIIAPKKAAAKFKKKYPNETVIHTARIYTCLTLIILFCFGEMLGKYIVPFFYFKNTFAINNIWMYIWLICVGLWVFSVWLLSVIFSGVYVFSNKRIELTSAFSYANKFVKKRSIEYSEIGSVQKAAATYIIITNKNTNSEFYIAAVTKAKKVIKLINKNLEKLRLGGEDGSN